MHHQRPTFPLRSCTSASFYSSDHSSRRIPLAAAAACSGSIQSLRSLDHLAEPCVLTSMFVSPLPSFLISITSRRRFDSPHRFHSLKRQWSSRVKAAALFSLFIDRAGELSVIVKDGQPLVVFLLLSSIRPVPDSSILCRVPRRGRIRVRFGTPFPPHPPENKEDDR